jgi:hypothetical protein
MEIANKEQHCASGRVSARAVDLDIGGMDRLGR